MKYISLIKFGVVLFCLYLAYDYGVKTANAKFFTADEKMWISYEKKQNEAYELALKLVEGDNAINSEFRVIEKKVIEYVATNDKSDCIVSDVNWMRIRADALRTHNRAIGFEQSTGAFDGEAKAVND